MTAYLDLACGGDLRTETRLSPGVLLVSYRAPGPGHPLREAYDVRTATAAPAYARWCLDDASEADREQAA